jgi:hypothetical protein
MSALPRWAFALAISTIQLGWLLRAAGAGFGVSGFVIALSNHVDLDGLHRFDGLDGGEAWPSSAVVL